MLDAQSNVALVIHARRVRELVRLEVHPGLRLVLVVRELSHNFAVDRATENEHRSITSGAKEEAGEPNNRPFLPIITRPSSLHLACYP